MRTTILIVRDDRSVAAVSATIRCGLAIHQALQEQDPPDPAVYTVTHVASGTAIVRTPLTARQAVRLRRRLLKEPIDWSLGVNDLRAYYLPACIRLIGELAREGYIL